MDDVDVEARWGVLAIAGVCGLCCLSLAALGGGAAVLGGTAIGVTATSGLVRSAGGLVVTTLATAVPLLVIGWVLRRRARRP